MLGYAFCALMLLVSPMTVMKMAWIEKGEILGISGNGGNCQNSQDLSALFASASSITENSHWGLRD